MKITLTFADANTGIVLDENGQWSTSPRPGNRYSPEFETNAEAQSFMKAYLDRHPYAECWITTNSNEPQCVVSPKFEEYLREKRIWKAWKASWWRRLFEKEPKGLYFQP